MHHGPQIYCAACGAIIDPGDATWWTSRPLHCALILCWHCGIAIEIAAHRIRVEDARCFSPIGSTYPET